MLVLALHRFWCLKTGKRDIELAGVAVGSASDIYQMTLIPTSWSEVWVLLGTAQLSSL